MERKYEFVCPQFVDFCSGVEGTPSVDLNFGFPDKRSELLLKSKYPVRKRNPQIRILSSTPVNKRSFVNTSYRTNTTDSAKINCRTRKIFKRLSKSVDSVHYLPEEKEQEFFPVICRKRSISATDDIRPKKLTRPTTPECLKRSLYNSKNKVFKTTEELELEKIAQLRKQTFNHLRENETAMRRLKMKQACNIQKDYASEDKNSAGNLPSGCSSLMGRMKGFARNLSYRSQRQVAEGRDSVLNSDKMLPCSNRFFESRSNLAGPSRICPPSMKNNVGAFKYAEVSHVNKNAGNVFSMNFLRPPLKSRRCLFQENNCLF